MAVFGGEAPVRRPDGQPAPPGHGIARIDHQIEQDLDHLAGVGANLAEAVGQQGFDRDVLADHAAQHLQGLSEDGIEIDDARLEDLLAREGEELPGELSGALGGDTDLIEVPAQRIVGGERLERQLTEAGDRGEEIVEVVRDPTGEPSDGLHPLPLAQLRLELPVPGDVALDADDVRRVPDSGGRDRGRDLDPGSVAPQAGELVARRGRFTADPGAPELEHLLDVIGREGHRDVPADEIARELVTVEPDEGRIHVDQALGGLECDRLGRGIEDGGHALLALGEPPALAPMALDRETQGPAQVARMGPPLDQKVVGAGAQNRDFDLFAGLAREHHHGHLRDDRAQRRERLESLDAGESEVEQDDVGSTILRRTHGRLELLRPFDLEQGGARRAELCDRNLGVRGVVLDEQYGDAISGGHVSTFPAKRVLRSTETRRPLCHLRPRRGSRVGEVHSPPCANALPPGRRAPRGDRSQLRRIGSPSGGDDRLSSTASATSATARCSSSCGATAVAACASRRCSRPPARRSCGSMGCRATLETIVVLERGKARVRSDAALFLARRLPWPWPLLAAFILLPRPLRDALYGIVARHRYRWFGRRESCMLPSADTADRFLD